MRGEVWEIGEDAALLPRGPEMAEEFHGLLVRNRERLRRWDPGACPEPLTRAQVRERLVRDARALAAGTRVPLAVAVLEGAERRLVGGLSLRLGRRGTGEIGYWLDAAYEGRGLATRAVAALLDHAFTRRSLHRVDLSTSSDNLPSRALAERLGFTPAPSPDTPEPPTDPLRALHPRELTYTMPASRWLSRPAHSR
ncbi:GNAT family N-acetyltransferase [Actinocorallia sp. API 0066]|uniref:GNAT family N-acetyltransferase n=1 Tax=Actinocorallia sp. API 0066 TaxID=2896846 RepID=UPI001E534F16|nr:GNAT family protein [Actinocorallia sp. API 0066]MCD0449676.1 GNAT family N-acetyltransferase [Actinocorallia sp. API 0066]